MTNLMIHIFHMIHILSSHFSLGPVLQGPPLAREVFQVLRLQQFTGRPTFRLQERQTVLRRLP